MNDLIWTKWTNKEAAVAEADPNEKINVHQAKTHFSKLLERAHAGEEIVVHKAGRPYAKLVPLQPKQQPERRVAGRLEGLIPPIPDSAWFDPLPEEELRRWEGR